MVQLTEKQEEALMRRTFTAVALLALLSLARGASAQPAVAEGEKVYADNCAECHGKNLVSGGAVFDLKQLGPNDKARYMNVMTEGKGQMPSFVGTLDDGQIEQVWAYIRSKAD